jgi:hypothetical protein
MKTREIVIRQRQLHSEMIVNMHPSSLTRLSITDNHLPKADGVAYAICPIVPLCIRIRLGFHLHRCDARTAVHTVCVLPVRMNTCFCAQTLLRTPSCLCETRVQLMKGRDEHWDRQKRSGWRWCWCCYSFFILRCCLACWRNGPAREVPLALKAEIYPGMGEATERNNSVGEGCHSTLALDISRKSSFLLV